MRDAWLLLGALCVATAMISGAGARQAPKSKPEDWVETPPKASGAQEAQRVVVSADTDAWHLKETILSEQDTYIKYEEKVRSGEDTSSPEPAASPSREPEAATNKSTANATKVAPSSETAAPDAKETTPYEDDPRHLERQHMEDFVAITEKIYVVKRNFNLDRVERCESAQRLRQLSDTQYEYLLRTRHYQSPALMSMKVFFKISKTGVHKDYNAVTYTHGPDEPSIERKLMYISPDKTCAILVEDLKRRRKGCQLVQPESAIENGIPLECNKVYEARCGRKSLILYEPICKTLPDSVPHEEL
ncbi:uncharacterized protein [Dermacentor albipictus]|uniref:uncharacterized protein n=1 Tax=Dermacentor albipictus TaxID=60249 RepID=UPI0038FD0E4C